MATKHIDLNCDMGESYGRWTLGADEEIMPWITSANVACGFHGGDPHVMRKTVALALRHGVAIGSHPGLPDRKSTRLNSTHSQISLAVFCLEKKLTRLLSSPH